MSDRDRLERLIGIAGMLIFIWFAVEMRNPRHHERRFNWLVRH
jgi:hypothetical protein